MTLDAQDPRTDPEAWAARVGVSRAAVDLLAASDCIDLHVESFLWTRLFGYNLARRHGEGLLGARFYSQVDLPRLLSSGMTGAVFSIVTNPLCPRRRRSQVFLRNLARLRAIIEAHPSELALVRDHAGYMKARAAGKAAIFLAIQGGNALDSAPGDLGLIPDELVSRITVIHMQRSSLGAASFPLGGGHGGLTPAGRDYIAGMNARRILVDLSHISERGFWDALDVHDPTQPAIVSHTGVKGVHNSWRNLDDAQIKAIAKTGGVIGVVFHSLYLDGSLLGTRADRIVDHLAHVITVAGEDHVALGSDWDGLIVTPRDMKTILEIPVLVQRLLDRGFSEARIRKILGQNYLRVMQAIRP